MQIKIPSAFSSFRLLLIAALMAISATAYVFGYYVGFAVAVFLAILVAALEFDQIMSLRRYSYIILHLLIAALVASSIVAFVFDYPGHSFCTGILAVLIGVADFDRIVKLSQSPYRMMWRLLGAAAALTIGICLFLDLCGFSAAVGGFPLKVQVQSASGTPITAVDCEVCWDVSQIALPGGLTAEAFFALPYFRDHEHFLGGGRHTSRPYNGQILEVNVQSGGHFSILLGRTLSYHQERHLVLVAEYPDGRRVCKIVEIPDASVSRSVTVVVP